MELNGNSGKTEKLNYHQLLLILSLIGQIETLFILRDNLINFEFSKNFSKEFKILKKLLVKTLM